METVPQPDETRVQQFERHRLGGGSDPLDSFLPPQASAAYEPTLEELICIDLELRFKADESTEPMLEDYAALLSPEVAAGVHERLAQELVLLRARFATVKDQVGSRIGPYELRDVAGQGAFATVWRARDPRLRRDVAIKVPHGSLDDDASFARLNREAHSVAQLRHPGVVSVFEVGSHEGRPYIVSDFVAGPSLREVMHTPRTFDQVAQLLADLAAAVHYAHTCGVVHRDVKPSNVLLPGPDQPMLTDFGLAALDSAESDLTLDGDLMGTPSAMAPEQARGDRLAVGPATDVYALGVMLYELLTGKPAFSAASVAATLYAVVHKTPVSPRRARGDVPIDLETICLRAMAKVPGERYASAADLESDLRRYLARRPIEARRQGRVARLKLWARRNPAVAASLGAGLVAVLVVSAIGLRSVLHERARFRTERDRARLNLYDSLVAEAALRVQTKASGWYQDAIQNIRRAVGLNSPAFDESKLRNLVLRIHAERSYSFQSVGTWDAPDDPTVLIASDDASQAVVEVSRDGMLRLRDFDGRLRWKRAGAFTCAAWDAKRAVLYAGDKQGVVLCLTAAGLDVARWRGESSLIHGLVLNPSGTRVAVLSSERQVSVLGATDKGLVIQQVLQGGDGGTNCATFTGDESALLTGGEDGMIRRHELGASVDAVVVCENSDPIRHITTMTGDNFHVAVCTREMLGHWIVDLRTGSHSQAARSHAQAVSGLHPFRRSLISTSWDGSIRARHLDGKRLATVQTGMGRIVASTLAGGLLFAVHADGRTSVWRYGRPPGTVLIERSPCAAFATDRFETAIITHAGTFAVAPGPHVDRILDSNFTRTSQQWAAARCRSRDVVAAAAHDGSVHLYDEHGHLVRTLRKADGNVAWSLAYDPGSQELAVGVGTMIEVYESDHVLPSKQLLPPKRLKGHDKLVVGLAYHPSRPLLVSTSLDLTTRLWAHQEQRELGRLDTGGKRLRGIAFDADGQRLAGAANDGSILIWTEVEPGSSPAQILKAHDVAVWSVAFSADGQLMASASQDGLIVLWRAKTLEVIARIAGGSRLARQVVFGGGGRYLMCACYGKPGSLWDLKIVRGVLRDIGLDWRD